MTLCVMYTFHVSCHLCHFSIRSSMFFLYFIMSAFHTIICRFYKLHIIKYIHYMHHDYKFNAINDWRNSTLSTKNKFVVHRLIITCSNLAADNLFSANYWKDFNILNTIYLYSLFSHISLFLENIWNRNL